MKPTGASSPSSAVSVTLLKSMVLKMALSASLSSGSGWERMASWGGAISSVGVFSGGEVTDGLGFGDLGGVEGCTNSVKLEVEDMISEEWWMNRGI